MNLKTRFDFPEKSDETKGNLLEKEDKAESSVQHSEDFVMACARTAASGTRSLVMNGVLTFS